MFSWISPKSGASQPTTTPAQPGAGDGAGAGAGAGATALSAEMKWLSKVHQRQQARMTPEMRASVQRRVAQMQRAKVNVRRAGTLSMCSAVSKKAWSKGMKSVGGAMKSEGSAPARGMRMRHAQTESCEHMLSVQSTMERAVMGVGGGGGMMMDGVDDELEEMEGELRGMAADAMSEELAVDMAAPARAAAQATALALPAAALEQQLAVGAGEMEALLAQLRVEPETDDERAAKFGLYETFSETTQKARGALFTFWEGCRDDFGEDGGGGGGQARAGVERALARLDRPENWAIEFHEGRWFAFDMARKCDANNGLIDSTLGSIKTKLELLARQDDCPICLEPLADEGEGEGAATVVLGCCHKVCKECWDEWTKLKRGHAFCPLCRNDDFLGDVVEGHAVPAPLWAQVRSAVGET